MVGLGPDLIKEPIRRRESNGLIYETSLTHEIIIKFLGWTSYKIAL